MVQPPSDVSKAQSLPAYNLPWLPTAHSCVAPTGTCVSQGRSGMYQDMYDLPPWSGRDLGRN